TAISHEYHAKFAEEESRAVRRKVGSGSWVFVMARAWRPGDRPAGDRSNPAIGGTLRTPGGREVFDFSGARFEAYAGHLERDPCGGGTVEVDPGLYLLERPGAGGERLAQVVTAVGGWQTQVFLLRRPPDGEGGGTFAGTTVFLSEWRGPGGGLPPFPRGHPPPPPRRRGPPAVGGRRGGW